jgi:hypothetical protein
MVNLLGAIQALAAPAPVTAARPAPSHGSDIHIPLPSAEIPLEVHSAALDRTSASMPVTRLKGSISPGGTPVQFLVDSGATALFLDTALAKRCNLVPRPSGRTIRLADGTIRDAAGTVTTTCTLTGERGESQSFQAEFCVTELRGHEAILGMPWLHHFNPATNWRTGRFTIDRPGHAAGPLELLADGPAPVARTPEECREEEAQAAFASQPRLVAKPASHKEWRKMLRKGLLDMSSMELIRLRDADSPQAQAFAAARAQGLAAAETLPQHPGLAKLLEEFKDVSPDKLGPVDHAAPSPGGITHKIELVPDAKPHAAPLRRYSPIEDAEIRRVVEEQVALGRMRESTSPWGAMVLLAKKKDGTLRFCVDYRVLNIEQHAEEPLRAAARG